MAKKLTTEQAKAKLREIYGNDYDYSEVEYVDNRTTKIKVICLKHGPFYRTYSSLVQNQVGCPECRKSIPKIRDTQTLIERAREVHGDKYDYSKTEFKNSRSKVIVTCPNHGDFEVLPTNLVKGRGCPKCADKSWTQEEFINKGKEIHGNQFNYDLVKFEGFKNRVTLKCNYCGNIFDVLPQHHIQGRKCPKCCERHKVTVDEFIERSKKEHPGIEYDYSLVTELNTLQDYVTIICPKHGPFQQKAAYHITGCGCQKCNTSIGENKIKEFLNNNLIEYKHNHQIELEENIIARNSNIINVDFYIDNHNNKRYIIEFNGKQHYIYNDFYYKSKEDFIKQQNRDQVVRDFCKDNNIELIEISYEDENKLEEILTQKLLNNGNISK